MAGKELICPNCGPGTKCHDKEGGGLVCETCGGTFRYEAGEAKLQDVGELDRLKESTAKNAAEIEAIKSVLPTAVPTSAELVEADAGEDYEEPDEDEI